jgi:hypothetical protein
MKQNYLFYALICCLLGFPLYGQAQSKKDEKFGPKKQNVAVFGQQALNNAERCGAAQYEMEMRARFPQMGTVENFEQWISLKTAERKARPSAQRSGTVKIPVIVHIVHNNGEAVGVGRNLPAEQVYSQIRVLNEDFQRLNADRANTPPLFASVAASMDIEFVLATRRPDGTPLAEPGINRVNGQALFGKTTWGGSNPSAANSDVNTQLKPNTIFDPTKYYNMWTVQFGSAGLLGFAQFPEASTLSGIPPGGSGTAQTDGVVMNYRAFGTNYDENGVKIYNFDLLSSFDRGRTTTHEVGHGFGLRHIWGDGNCSVDDFCADTPQAGTSNTTGSPCNFPGPNTCTESNWNGTGADAPDMFQNYMDYSDDVCMNLFTADQVARMETVLANSPRRKELPNSDAADPVPIFAAFNFNSTVGCAPITANFTNNSGTTPPEPAITSWTWNFDKSGLGGASPATFSGQNPPAVTFSNGGTYVIELTVSNGSKSASFSRELVVNAPTSPAALPIIAGFEAATLPTGWSATSSAAQGWEVTTAAAQQGTRSVRVDNYNNDLRGATVLLRLPNVNLNNAASGTLKFFVAYAPYSATFSDGLQVVVSEDCGATFNTIFSKSGTTLATAPTTTNAFVPTAAQWREETIDLAAAGLLGKSNILLAFRNVSGYGNMLYIDNVRLEAVSASNVAAPSALSATAVAHNQINLAWTDNANNEEGFKIERSLSANSGFEQIATVDANVSSYQDNSVSERTTYHYRVRAYEGSDNSSFSNTSSASTPAAIAAPTALSATADSFEEISIAWTDNATNENNYVVERSLSATTGFASIATLPANSSSYTDNTVDEGTTYHYRVKAINGVNQDSDYSNTSSAATPLETVPAPSTLSATVNGNAVQLSWTDNANNETSYRIERSTSESSGFSQIASVEANSNSYTDNLSVTSNTTYFYRVRAAKGTANFSEYSNTASASITVSSVDARLSQATKLYPNPASQSFVLSLEGLAIAESKAILYNSLGQNVSERSVSSQQAAVFEVSGLQKGLYYVRIASSQGLIVKKVVVE